MAPRPKEYGRPCVGAHSIYQDRDRESGPADPPDDPGNPTVNFHGEKRSNETHQSTTAPESRLYRKGRGQESSRLLKKLTVRLPPGRQGPDRESFFSSLLGLQRPRTPCRSSP